MILSYLKKTSDRTSTVDIALSCGATEFPDGQRSVGRRYFNGFRRAGRCALHKRASHRQEFKIVCLNIGAETVYQRAHHPMTGI